MRDGDNDFIDRVSAELRAPVRVDGAFDRRVMDAVRASVPPTRGAPAPGARLAAGGGWRWWLRPRVVRISPLAGLATAAGVAGLVALAAARVTSRPGDSLAAGPARSAAAPPVTAVARPAGRALPAVRAVPVRFAVAPGAARSVSVIGDFNDWDATATPLERAPDGRWRATVLLPPGRYEYALVVDGVRVLPDPAAPQTASEFGAPNSVLTVDGGLP